MTQAWQGWVALWGHVEHPRSMALIRICLGLCVLWDLSWVALLDLVEPLFTPHDGGGWSGVLNRPHPGWWYQVLPVAPQSAWVLWACIWGSALCWTLGLGTRLALLAFVLCSAQAAWIMPNADRGIDILIRNLCLILCCSQCGAWLSLDALRRTGRIWGDDRAVPAWPRHLVICQLIGMYFLAGIQKFGVHWSAFGDFNALYLILQDPAIANADYGWIASQPWLAITRLGTAVTIAWEWSTPLLLLVFWYRHTADRPGRVRAWSNLAQPHWIWAGVGVIFHIGIAATMDLGIFPFAMLATYWAFLHPDELARAWKRVGSPS